MAKDPDDIGHSRGQGDSRSDRTRTMLSYQGSNFGFDDVVGSAAIGKHTKMIVHLPRPVHADSNADPILGEKLNDRGSQKSGIGSEAEIDVPLLFRGLAAGISNHLFEKRKVHEGLAAEKGDVYGTAFPRLGQQKVHRLPGGFEIHELGLTFRRGYLVCPELVAVLAGKVALVRQ